MLPEIVQQLTHPRIAVWFGAVTSRSLEKLLAKRRPVLQALLVRFSPNVRGLEMTQSGTCHLSGPTR